MISTETGIDLLSASWESIEDDGVDSIMITPSPLSVTDPTPTSMTASSSLVDATGKAKPYFSGVKARHRKTKKNFSLLASDLRYTQASFHRMRPNRLRTPRLAQRETAAPMPIEPLL